MNGRQRPAAVRVLPVRVRPDRRRGASLQPGPGAVPDPIRHASYTGAMAVQSVAKEPAGKERMSNGSLSELMPPMGAATSTAPAT